MLKPIETWRESNNYYAQDDSLILCDSKTNSKKPERTQTLTVAENVLSDIKSVLKSLNDTLCEHILNCSIRFEHIQDDIQALKTQTQADFTGMQLESLSATTGDLKSTIGESTTSLRKKIQSLGGKVKHYFAEG